MKNCLIRHTSPLLKLYEFCIKQFLIGRNIINLKLISSVQIMWITVLFGALCSTLCSVCNLVRLEPRHFIYISTYVREKYSFSLLSAE